VLNDGSRWEVYKRYFVGVGARRRARRRRGLFDGNWFVVVRSRR
jgi:hypothetical protein